jgi:hypothetical protein
LPYYRVVLQRTTECVIQLDAATVNDVDTEAFRQEYGLPSATGRALFRDPDPVTWHRVDRNAGAGAIVWTDTGWQVVFASDKTPGRVTDADPQAQAMGNQT